MFHETGKLSLRKLHLKLTNFKNKNSLKNNQKLSDEIIRNSCWNAFNFRDKQKGEPKIFTRNRENNTKTLQSEKWNDIRKKRVQFNDFCESLSWTKIILYFCIFFLWLLIECYGTQNKWNNAIGYEYFCIFLFFFSSYMIAIQKAKLEPARRFQINII